MSTATAESPDSLKGTGAPIAQKGGTRVSKAASSGRMTAEEWAAAKARRIQERKANQERKAAEKQKALGDKKQADIDKKAQQEAERAQKEAVKAASQAIVETTYEPAPLSPQQAARLEQLEAEGEVYRAAYNEAGEGLARTISIIRTERLYTAYPSFHAYCKDRWGYSGVHTSRVLALGNFQNYMIQNVLPAALLAGEENPEYYNFPTKEQHTRELSRAGHGDPAIMAQAWATVVRECRQDGMRPPNAADIRRVVNRDYIRSSETATGLDAQIETRDSKTAGREPKRLLVFIPILHCWRFGTEFQIIQRGPRTFHCRHLGVNEDGTEKLLREATFNTTTEGIAWEEGIAHDLWTILEGEAEQTDSALSAEQADEWAEDYEEE